jgi:hypothetical protein
MPFQLGVAQSERKEKEGAGGRAPSSERMIYLGDALRRRSRTMAKTIMMTITMTTTMPRTSAKGKGAVWTVSVAVKAGTL